MKNTRKFISATVLVVALAVVIVAFFATRTNGAAQTAWALLAPVIAITLALVTKEVYSSLFVGVLVGALLNAGYKFSSTVDAIINDGLIAAVADSAGIFIFLVMLGTNDLLQGATAKEAAARMEAFLKLSLPHCQQILLVAPPPVKRGAWVPSDALVAESIRLAEEYKLLAETLSIPFVDTCHWNIPLTFDGVHFTEEGHHAFSNYLIRYL